VTATENAVILAGMAGMTIGCALTLLVIWWMRHVERARERERIAIDAARIRPRDDLTFGRFEARITPWTAFGQRKSPTEGSE
jgi:hypothetical protein